MSVIRRELEKELNLLRATHSRTLHGTDGNLESGDLVQIGKDGEDFEFNDLPMKVQTKKL